MAATLGQAFDLAYKKYLEAKRTTPAKEVVNTLRKKVHAKPTILNAYVHGIFHRW